MKAKDYKVKKFKYGFRCQLQIKTGQKRNHQQSSTTIICFSPLNGSSSFSSLFSSFFSWVSSWSFFSPSKLPSPLKSASSPVSGNNLVSYIPLLILFFFLLLFCPVRHLCLEQAFLSRAPEWSVSICFLTLSAQHSVYSVLDSSDHNMTMSKLNPNHSSKK